MTFSPPFYSIARHICMLALPMSLTGCLMWSPWEVTTGYKDLPYANGAQVPMVARDRECLGCTTGRQVENALRVDGRAVSQRDIGEAAAELIRKWPDPGWRFVSKSDDGRERWFAPIRIFTPSLEPMIVMTIPWSYKGDPHSGTVSTEMYSFTEWRHKEPSFAASWAGGMINRVEIRSSLPKEARTVRILSKNASATVDLPVERSRKASIVFEGQKISFERTDAGTIQVDFPEQ